MGAVTDTIRRKLTEAFSPSRLDLVDDSDRHHGHAGARKTLATPVDDRLFFAGEATSPNFFSTAHGAWESGVRAAEQVMASVAAQA